MTDYSPLLSRKKLDELLTSRAFLADHLRGLHGNSVVVANAILRGKTVSNLRYEVGADIEIARCDAIIGDLRRRFHLPISREMVTVKSRSGHLVKRAKYTVTDSDKEALFSNPGRVFKYVRKTMFIHRTTEESRAINRLAARYGKSGAVKRVVRHVFKDKSVSKTDLLAATHQIDLICEKLSGVVK